MPRRLTTGRDPQPYWEDTQPVFSPDGTRVAYADDGWVCVVPTAGGPPRKVVEAGSPAWIGNDRLVVSVERDRCDRLAVVSVVEAWPQRLARVHGDLDAHGDEQGAIVSPDGSAVAYVFVPHSDYSRYEVRVVDVDDGAVRALTGTPGIRDYVLDWSPDGTTLAVASELSGWFELHLVAADGSGARRLTTAGADFLEARWHPDGSRLVATRGRAGRFDLVTVAAADGTVTDLARGGVWGAPAWAAAGRILASYESPTEPPDLRLVTEGEAPVAIHAPAPLAITSAPHVVAEELTLHDVRRPRDPGVSLPAVDGLRRATGAPRSSTRTAAPQTCYGGEWDGHAQYFVDRGYAWFAINYRGSTGHGSDFERANHGVWGVDDTKDCLAAADYLRTVDWVDGDRLGIFGSSYGSYLALLSVTDDPEYRFRCADLQVRRLRRPHDLGPGGSRRRPDADADHGASEREARGLPRRLTRAPARCGQGADSRRARAHRPACSVRAVERARGGADAARQDLRVRDLPDRGARISPGRAATRLLPAIGGIPRLVPDVTGHCRAAGASPGVGCDSTDSRDSLRVIGAHGAFPFPRHEEITR